MKHVKSAVHLSFVLLLAACGSSHLSIENPGGGALIEGGTCSLIEGGTCSLSFPPGEAVKHSLPKITGGIPPYESHIEGCPDWVTLLPSPDQRENIIAGTAPVALGGQTFFCTYHVTEADPGFRTQRSDTLGLQLTVPTLNVPDLMLPRPDKVSLSVGTFDDELFPPAAGGVQPYTYSLTCAGGSLPSGMSFAPATRRFAGTPNAHFRDSCTYSVTDSLVPANTVSRAVEIQVVGPVTGTLMLPESVVPGNVLRLRVNERARVTFKPATGGVQPYTYELQCPNLPPTGPSNPVSVLPPDLGFGPQTRVLSGTPSAAYTGPDCTYSVTDSATPPATLARSVALIIEPERAKWRFNERSLVQRDRPLNRNNVADPQPVHNLPEAEPEDRSTLADTAPVYRLRSIGPPLRFDPATRELGYVHRGSDPPLGRTSTYRYQVLFGDTVDDTLCIHVSYRDEDAGNPDDRLIASVRIHDDAYWDGAEFHCPPVPLQLASASRAAPSNPVHTALAPVHARRALDVAHAAVQDRVRSWTPGTVPLLSAFAPAVGLASLSGSSEGFEYTGSSESVSAGAELGTGSWQAGLVASFTATDLHYRAAADFDEHGYRAGEHNTELFSLHPFAAWHLPSGANVWASLGAGMGELRHRDDLGFPSWSRSDVRLRTYVAGASVPLADVLSGELEAEAGIEAFAFEIEGGGRISSSLPTQRGRDYRAGLTWSAPIPGTPSLSMAYKHLTGDGPEGGRLEARGSVSAAGMFDPRLTLIANAEGSFGLGDYGHDSWGLSGGVRFAPGEARRGFGLELDTRLVSPDDEGSSDVGLRGEAGYGLWSGPFLGTLRPYVGLTRYSGDGSLRRSVGIDLRDTPNSRAKVEAYDQSRDRLRVLKFTLDHRF